MGFCGGSALDEWLGVGKGRFGGLLDFHVQFRPEGCVESGPLLVRPEITLVEDLDVTARVGRGVEGLTELRGCGVAAELSVE